MIITKALALTGVKVILDDGLFEEVSAFIHRYLFTIILTYPSLADQEGL